MIKFRQNNNNSVDKQITNMILRITDHLTQQVNKKVRKNVINNSLYDMELFYD